MKENLIANISYDFALKIIGLCRALSAKKEFIVSQQLLKSGTSIGANVEEALSGQSRADFVAKMSIALKEARECNYWLRLIRDSEMICQEEISATFKESGSILRILTSIIKTTKETIPKYRAIQLNRAIKKIAQLNSDIPKTTKSLIHNH